MKARNFKITFQDGDWTVLDLPIYFRALQIENVEGNSPVEYRWAGGESRIIPPRAYAEWKASEYDPLRNEVEVRGVPGETLVGEYWVDNEQV